MRIIKRITVAILGFGVLVAGAASAQDWPQWRGANRDAKATGFIPPKTWPKEVAPKWKVNVGLGDATPAFVGDKLYVFSRQEGNEVTLCLDAATGKELWQEKYDALGATGPASGHSGPRSSPAVSKGKVVTLGVRGMLSCLDAVTGKKLWRKDDLAGAWPQFFTSSSPVIVDDLAVAQLGGRGNGAVIAYDLASGEQKWKSAGEGPGYASPALMTAGGVKLIVAQTETRMMALRSSDGKVVWEAPFAVQGRGYNSSTPVIEGDTLIYSGSGRGTKAVKLEKQGDDFTAKELWSNPTTSAQFNTPVLRNGLLFGLTQAGEFFCINAKTGESAWTAAQAATAAGGGGRGRGGGGGGYGSIVDAGPVLLALTPKSQLIVLEPSDKEYNELASIKVAETETYAYPLVTGNRVFIKDRESLALFTVE